MSSPMPGSSSRPTLVAAAGTRIRSSQLAAPVGAAQRRMRATWPSRGRRHVCPIATLRRAPRARSLGQYAGAAVAATASTSPDRRRATRRRRAFRGRVRRARSGPPSGRHPAAAARPGIRCRRCRSVRPARDWTLARSLSPHALIRPGGHGRLLRRRNPRQLSTTREDARTTLETRAAAPAGGDRHQRPV